ncbi:hypothetical protein ACHAXA_007219 [Cyclostephanos tholiformis]|uniref:Uncharacterized protein n=1 Tax=Cyclostephanos tholiformis TaxID=382380 RepID=A0ABD3RG55_9STRA
MGGPGNDHDDVEEEEEEEEEEEDGGDFLWNLDDEGNDEGGGWRAGGDAVAGEDADVDGFYEKMVLGLGSSGGTRVEKKGGEGTTKTKKKKGTKGKRRTGGGVGATATSSLSSASLLYPLSSTCGGGDVGFGCDDHVETSFVLHDASDEEHINAIHNIVRRDVWEGFVVGTTSTTASSARGKGDDTGSRSTSRLERYAGTIGFRCRFCKVAPPGERAEKSAVYPRSLERIYLSNIRFQRDHIMQCNYIPSAIKEEYSRLKNSKGVTRGKKKYWVTSAMRRGLCNGSDGIIFTPPEVVRPSPPVAVAVSNNEQSINLRFFSEV